MGIVVGVKSVVSLVIREQVQEVLLQGVGVIDVGTICLFPWILNKNDRVPI